MGNSAKLSNTVTYTGETSIEERLLAFCETPKTRQEIADFLNIKTINHVMKNYVTPMVNKGLLVLKYPEKPRSSKQEYTSKKKQ